MQSLSSERVQLEKLNHLLKEVWTGNRFYARKWRQASVAPKRLSALADFASFPLTTRDELLAGQTAAPPLGMNLTCLPADLKRFHRSSGTTRAPLLWADSAESWQWVMQCSQRLWQLAGVGPADRVLFLISFGASSGPWIIYEGACRLGCACFPVGPAEPDEQIRWMKEFKPTVLAGKPGVLEPLALAAKTRSVSARDFSVRRLILCGAHDATRRVSLERPWGAQCFDRYGLTEAGSVASECTAHPGGLHLLDDEFIAESIDPDSGQPVPDGQLGELVLTNLGRVARPIIRYRTGDLVRLVRYRECACGRRGAILLGGVTRRAVA
jgi:phenylacetate-CoA ligase